MNLHIFIIGIGAALPLLLGLALLLERRERRHRAHERHMRERLEYWQGMTDRERDRLSRRP